MKILLISASPRGFQSNTLKLAREVGKATGVEVEEVRLNELKIEFCRSCEVCHQKIMTCPIKDDAFSVLKKMLSADGLILATPNYINQVTGSLKTLMDRSSHFVHCLRLLNKYAVGVVSSGAGLDSPVLNYLKEYTNLCGAQYSGGVSAASFRLKEKYEEAASLGKKLLQDIQEKTVYPDQVAFITNLKKNFGNLIQMRKNDWKEEYAYWVKQGWLK